MGDRCWMQITCHKSYVPIFQANNYCINEENEIDEYLTDLVCYERNYADTESLPRGFPYYGCHLSGGCYGPGIFVHDGNEFIYMNSDHDNAYPVIGVDSNGKLCQAELRFAKRYWKLLAKVKKELESYNE